MNAVDADATSEPLAVSFDGDQRRLTRRHLFRLAVPATIATAALGGVWLASARTEQHLRSAGAVRGGAAPPPSATTPEVFTHAGVRSEYAEILPGSTTTSTALPTAPIPPATTTGSAATQSSTATTNPPTTASTVARTRSAADAPTTANTPTTRTERPAASTPPTEPIPPPADPLAAEDFVRLGSISIPKLGVDAPLLEGIRLTTLDRGPGHWPGTAMPGEKGNVVVAAHRTSHGAPFRHLDLLNPGDSVVFNTADRTIEYDVVGTRIVEPEALWIVDQTDEPSATLFACHPPGKVDQRIVVRLELAA